MGDDSVSGAAMMVLQDAYGPAAWGMSAAELRYARKAELKPENMTATEIMLRQRAAYESMPWRARQEMLDRLAGQLMESVAIESHPMLMIDPAMLGDELQDMKPGKVWWAQPMRHNPLAAMCDYRDTHNTERLPVSKAKPAIVGILTQRAVTHRLGLGVSYE